MTKISQHLKALIEGRRSEALRLKIAEKTLLIAKYLGKESKTSSPAGHSDDWKYRHGQFEFVYSEHEDEESTSSSISIRFYLYPNSNFFQDIFYCSNHYTNAENIHCFIPSSALFLTIEDLYKKAEVEVEKKKVTDEEIAIKEADDLERVKWGL